MRVDVLEDPLPHNLARQVEALCERRTGPHRYLDHKRFDVTFVTIRHSFYAFVVDRRGGSPE